CLNMRHRTAGAARRARTGRGRRIRLDWSHLAIPALRNEIRFGDRVTPAFVERPNSIWAPVAEAAARRGDGEALGSGERRMTWREVAEASARVAAGMEALGIGAGDRIALLLGKRPEFVL